MVINVIQLALLLLNKKMLQYGSGIKKNQVNDLNFLIGVYQNHYFSFVKFRSLIFFSLLLISTNVFSQELNGIWKGTLTQQAGGCFPVYNVELQVNISGNNVSGFCYHYSDYTNYVKKNYSGVYNAANKTINIQEQK